jgi:hypothetical protein
MSVFAYLSRCIVFALALYHKIKGEVNRLRRVLTHAIWRHTSPVTLMPIDRFKRNTIIDTDPGLDDAIAILFALAASEHLGKSLARC